MTRGRVLVIDGDEWLSQALSRALEAAGFTVDVCPDARSGFTKACATSPDCIVSELELSDIDGYWLARKLRSEHGPVATVPILLLADPTRGPSRAQAHHAGADVLLERPVSNDDVVAQVEALVALARRLGADLEMEDAPQTSAMTAALRGDLAMFPLASVLMMFEMERRSGLVEVVSSAGKRIVLSINEGLFAATEIDGKDAAPVVALREVLSWRAGRFAFRTKDPKTLPAPRASVGALVLEAMRLEDEKEHGS